MHLRLRTVRTTQLLAVLLAITAVALVGCGGGDNGNGNTAPTVAAVVTPNPVVGGTAATFNLAGTSDQQSALTALQYRIDFEGNGTFTAWQAWPTNSTVVHTYAAVTTARTVNARIQVRDPEGLIGEKVVAVTINPPSGNQPPVGAFTITPGTGDTTTTFQFDPSASTDVEEPNTVEVRFNFGDLTPVTAWAPKTTVVSHQYLVPGTYTVTMNVRDSAASGADVVKSLTVSSVAAPVAYRSFSAFGYTAGSPINVSINATPTTTTAAYAVEDLPPTGWVITNISNSGVFDNTTGKVKWGPFFDNTPRTLTYTATPPAGTTGAQTFTGTFSVDGTDHPILGVQTISNL